MINHTFVQENQVVPKTKRLVFLVLNKLNILYINYADLPFVHEEIYGIWAEMFQAQALVASRCKPKLSLKIPCL